MFNDVEIKLKKGNKLLFNRESPCLQELTALIDRQGHRVLIAWALDCAKLPLQKLEAKYSDEPRPRACLAACEAWARGIIKMPEARQAILASHAAAKTINDPAYGALCHAIGHAGATVHVGGHALGLPFYELTAIVLLCRDDYQSLILEKIKYYTEQLNYWNENTDTLFNKWAVFLN